MSYSRGFKSGGYNYPVSLNPLLDPEIVESYELGYKSDFLERRLRIASALFVYDYRDLQVTRGGAGAFLATENAADARVRGFELDLELAMATDLAVDVGLAFTDSEYVDYTAGGARAAARAAVRQRAAAGRSRRARPVALALARRGGANRVALRQAAREWRPVADADRLRIQGRL